MMEEKRDKRGGGERKEKMGAGISDFQELARFYRDSYLEGLEVALKGQQEVEKLIREASNSAFGIWRDWIDLSRQWVQGCDQLASGDAGVPNPWLTLSKECAETACGAADVLLRATQDLFNSGFSLYEQAVAESVRKYTRQINKQSLDVMIQG